MDTSEFPILEIRDGADFLIMEILSSKNQCVHVRIQVKIEYGENQFHAFFERGALNSFRQALSELHRTLSGEAVLVSRDYDDRIIFHAVEGYRGKIMVGGIFTQLGSSEYPSSIFNEDSFRKGFRTCFDGILIDQSYLMQVIEQINAMLVLLETN